MRGRSVEIQYICHHKLVASRAEKGRGGTAADAFLPKIIVASLIQDIYRKMTIIPVYIITTVLHVICPLTRVVRGYACDAAGNSLIYRLNGLVVNVIMILLFLYCTPLDIQRSFYNNYQTNLVQANVLGLAASFFFVVRGGTERFTRCITVDQTPLNERGKSLSLAPTTPINILQQFFLGCEWNPRLFGIDVKMLLYLVGAVGLQLNVLSFYICHQHVNGGHTSNAMYLFVGLFTWFLFEYLLGEEVHLYTYDIFAEKIGFKLAWGCLVFYPFFYGICGFSLIHAKRDMSIDQCIATACLYLVGWCLTRGANMQKFFARTRPEDKYFLFVKQETIPGTRILCSGWWGLSRHINYFGEILQAVAITIPGYLVGPTPWLSWLPWLYPLYYVLLFVPRQFDDDALCKSKYGAKWDEYVQKVPYRIVPGVW